MLTAAFLPLTGFCAEQVAPPPDNLTRAWKLPVFYTKHTAVEGLPVLGSAKVSDYALLEAAHLIRQMIGGRTEILRAMARNRVRFVVMAPSEMTTDVPEHSDLTPKAYWDRRARGLGATSARPAVSCGEENLLELPGDPYATENILIHEFAHAIHEMGLRVVDSGFDRRLQEAYRNAQSKGLWKGTYAMENPAEYWAEATQSWFNCNRVNDREHGPIGTREELMRYDPEVAKLLAKVFGDGPWRYSKPSTRPPGERVHLAGFDPSKAGRFQWPEPAPSNRTAATPLLLVRAGKTPAASPRSAARATSVEFVNKRQAPLSIAWLDFKGTPQHYAEVRPGGTHLQSTHPGHVWVVSEGGTILGQVVASDRPGRVEIGAGVDAAGVPKSAP
jgi:hypothetical protein